MEQLLKAANKRNGKALSSLDFPLARPMNAVPLRFASDLVTWDQVQQEEWCSKHEEYPAQQMRWGLCATRGAYHSIHCNPDGFGTVITPESGEQLWFIGVPKEGKTFDVFADRNIFLSKDYDIHGHNGHLVDWMGLLIKPGTTL